MKHLALFSYNNKQEMPRKKNYLNNKDLYAQIVQSLEEDKLTRDAEKMLLLLAEKAINRLKFMPKYHSKYQCKN